MGFTNEDYDNTIITCVPLWSWLNLVNKKNSTETAIKADLSFPVSTTEFSNLRRKRLLKVMLLKFGIPLHSAGGGILNFNMSSNYQLASPISCGP